MNDIMINIPRLYTGLAEWLFCLLYILNQERRFKGWKLWSIIIGALLILALFQYFAGFLPLSLWIPGMMFAATLMFWFIYSTTRNTFLATGFYCAQAFVLAEFAASFEWQLHYFFIINTAVKSNVILDLLFLVFIYALIFGILFLVESRYKIRKFKLEINSSDLLSFLSITIIVFGISNISFLNLNTPISGRYPLEIFYIRSLVNFSGVLLLYALKEHKLSVYSKLEVIALENVLNKQYEHYLRSQDNIDMINQKYHDLKHQLSIIRSEKDLNKRESYLSELEAGIKFHNTLYKTGDRVLDTILTSKNILCLEYGINFTCVADGTLLDFLSTLDICSIFGNALDNAIESVREIDDREMRIIKVAVFSQRNLLLIRFENYYENQLKYENGNLTSTKNDGLNHGYGIKSIKSIVEKYNGSVTINTDNNWFRIAILIPMKD
ncbi:ATP-binding protein [Haloplasma contractile]|uniref:Histidine kinase-like ATPase protein n=1 Tax=Haloplasma contractile SSD-17B TaxID=1033810 RepID=F7PTU4_9MOLU|nr:ATP-binding protein [Haloplasma contractile]ERJ12259.1 Histidine kinase-like ATPase protein [Haloplasma contractile SSD-17B]